VHPVAVDVEHVTKRFRLLHDHNSTLKATVLRGFRRAQYEEFLALDDVSLSVPEGSTYGLIGRNGSGKSTLLKCMARIYRPDIGSIDVRGKMSALLELGAGFHPELSGRENGDEQARARRALRRDRRVRRPRALHRHTGEELLVGHVRAARLLGGDQRRARGAAGR
jgi:ABC-type polysaccharide/polyol phosphate transport system ATPase subunit